MARKRFKTVTHPFEEERPHTSEAKAYATVNFCREVWQAGAAPVTGVTVYEFDPVGDRWVVFDTHDFAKGE